MEKGEYFKKAIENLEKLGEIVRETGKPGKSQGILIYLTMFFFLLQNINLFYLQCFALFLCYHCFPVSKDI